MNESVALAKDVDAKKGSSSIHESDERIHRARNEPERQLGSLGAVISTIRSDGGTPSADSVATQLSSMPTGERAPVLSALQQTHGNRYVQRVVSGIQAKLVVGQPGDIYEQEADRVADTVMRMPASEVQRQPEEEEEEEELIQTKTLSEQITHLVQRQEGEEEEEEIQTKPLPSQTSEVVSDVETSINSIRGGGQPLPGSTRAFFEPRFGQDFSRVRVHTNTKAADTARAVNARAFTTGRDVVFGAGQYAPGTSEGRRLIAHELTHVVQQNLRRNHELQYKKKPKTKSLKEKLESKYKIKIVKGDTDWTEDEIKDLEWLLSRLKGKELTALAGYEFKRWTSSESRAKGDPTYIPPKVTECGMHEVDLEKGKALISMYDDCFDPHTTMLGVAVGRYNILHEIGHAMQDAEARAKQAEYNEIYAKYDKAFKEATKAIAEYTKANNERNALVSEYNGATPARQKALKPKLKKAIANAKKLEKKMKALLKKAKALEKKVDQAKKKVKAAVTRALNKFEALIKGKAPLTHYSKTSTTEAFAEAFALFKINPEAIKKVNKPLHNWFKAYGELKLIKRKKKKSL